MVSRRGWPLSYVAMRPSLAACPQLQNPTGITATLGVAAVNNWSEVALYEP